MSKIKCFSFFSSSEAENGVEDRKKVCRSPTVPSPAPSTEAESPDQKKSICLRSKSSFEGATVSGDKNECKTENKNVPKTERKKSLSSSQYKANMHFHKLFLEVPTEEPLRQSFTCALQKEILYQGKLFVSENWICFHSKVFGKDTKITIPAFSVTLIKKTKTALLVPNALIITTVTDRVSTPRARLPLPLACSGLLCLINLLLTVARTLRCKYYHLFCSFSVFNPTGQSETIGILPKCPAVQHILIFYAIVVCALIISTFYMRYRINTLEEQLGSLTTTVDTHSTEQTVSSGLGSEVQLNVEVLCQELTANIVKLEKIQNNLQKLLENGD
ncbi:PREDICTED: GRAM domain-containing protein 3 [Dipodomys ordii]|uniref:GRAM domain-containing protein 3 n=1 Tax=Dipodomys ordii TaxID=10020 RepID=A0A1S3F2X4_DIPOR|nr:PREDICTED: GRAM domain-containing protein 3 [Dipodomys ordii]